MADGPPGPPAVLSGGLAWPGRGGRAQHAIDQRWGGDHRWGTPARIPSPVVELHDERIASVRLLVKRDDLIDPELSGNKWRKLKYQLIEARELGASTLLTFGGAYSNHVRALAAAGRRYHFATVGVIRGEERPFNDQLARAVADGMRLHYLDRVTYRRKTDPDVEIELRGRFGDFYLIPEGGSAPGALRGCAELVAEIDQPFDLIVCPVGTGGTLAGLSTGLRPGQRALGFAVLRGAQYLDDEVRRLLRQQPGGTRRNWDIDHRFHGGGFARRTPELVAFIADFYDRHAIALDPVYVGKAMFGLFTLVRLGEIPPGSTVVFVVTGPAPTGSSPGRSRSTTSHRT